VIGESACNLCEAGGGLLLDDLEESGKLDSSSGSSGGKVAPASCWPESGRDAGSFP